MVSGLEGPCWHSQVLHPYILHPCDLHTQTLHPHAQHSQPLHPYIQHRVPMCTAPPSPKPLYSASLDPALMVAPLCSAPLHLQILHP